MDFNLNVPLGVDNEPRIPPRPERRTWRAFFVGWRRAAAYLVCFIFTLTLLLLTTFLVSLYGLDGSPRAIFDEDGSTSTTLLFRGDCDASTQYNFGAHLVINFIASGILASSNFFMQVLVAPTRADIDRAHAKGKALEIGVQSWRNLFVVPWRNRFFWVLLAISTIPLHLVFNSCVLESKASSDFLMLMTSEKFLEGAPWSVKAPPARLGEIQRSLSEEPSIWERMSIEDCYSRYNDFSRSLNERRDVVMVLELDQSDNNNFTGPYGWAFNGSAETSLWFFRDYRRTDSWVNERALRPSSMSRYGFGEDGDGNIDFDASTYTVKNKASKYPPELQKMKAQYCMSEIWKAPCRVEVDNTLLFTVVVICLIKCTLCIIVLATARGRVPLITPGDAIESFITKPDPATAGMCTFSCADFDRKQSHGGQRAKYGWVPAARPWRRTASRRSICAIPWGIWVWSYLLIGGSLCTGAVFVGISVNEQSITKSEFGHAPVNRQMETHHIDLSTITTMIVLANTPQLILSMSYFAYNGLFTRILSEWEWAKFSTTFKPLRTTHRKGDQKSTYRLQLPYRWSIPLLLVSALLHWLYSNSLYITIYEGYIWPRPQTKEVRGLAFSSKSIVISFFISIGVAIAPLILGIFKLPGNMPMARNSSAVISAACHSIPASSSHGAWSSETLDKPLLQGTSPVTSTNEYKSATCTEYKSANSAEDALWDMATGKLRWGVVLPTWAGRVCTGNDPGHLAFGSQEQEVSEAVAGSFYAGKKKT